MTAADLTPAELKDLTCAALMIILSFILIRKNSNRR